jgi:hypothetical protein
MQMKETAVSPNFVIYRDRPEVVVDRRTSREFSHGVIDTYILVYEDAVKGWFLEYARKLREDGNSGFVVLQIAMAQIEGIEQYYSGILSEGGSKDFFIRGMKRMLNIKDSAYDSKLRNLYKKCRCGLFHDGMTRQGVVLSHDVSGPIGFGDDGTLYISPFKLLNVVYSFFIQYIVDLKNPANLELRTNFEKVLRKRSI